MSPEGPTERLPAGLRRWLVEGALIAGLTIGWISAYVAASQNLDALTPAQRQFQLDLNSTALPLWFALVLGLWSCTALFLRHWWSMVSFLVVSVLVVVAEVRHQFVTSQNIVPELTLALTTFWAARQAGRSRAPFVLAGSMLAFVLSTGPAYRINPRLDALYGTNSSTLDALSGTLLAVFVAVAAYAAGRRFRQVNEQADELAERNAELAAERQARAQREVQDERVRIARELHDVVAHHVTTMTVHAGAARQLSEADPRRAGEAILQVEESGREAVAEMHRLLGFLRGEQDDDRAPAPTIGDLDALIDTVGGDIKVSIERSGEPRELSPTASLSAFRIVQEALTNAAKHSGAARVGVQVNYHDDHVELRVSDDGRGNGQAVNGSGHGLIGMRERALLHDGTLEAGPRDVGPDTQGGWLVRAVLPYGGNPS